MFSEVNRIMLTTAFPMGLMLPNQIKKLTSKLACFTFSKNLMHSVVQTKSQTSRDAHSVGKSQNSLEPAFNHRCNPLQLSISKYRYLSDSSSRSWFRRIRKGLKNYDIVELAEVGPCRKVPDYVKKPDYAETGVAEEPESGIEIQTPDHIKCMRESCALAKRVLDEVSTNIKVGVTTDMLDALAHSTCINLGIYPSPLNYRGFPKSICTSVNNIACHGIPDSRMLKDGDIISVDVSIFHNGYHGDCAATYAVGVVDAKGRKLLLVALSCLEEAIKMCQPGQPFSIIGKTISKKARSNRYSVVPAFCGHGIGSYFHGPPNVLHYENDDDRVMLEGMIFTIEPVICEGRPDIVVLEDGWTATTEDNSRCAQFEHTLLITENGSEILTVFDALKK